MTRQIDALAHAAFPEVTDSVETSARAVWVFFQAALEAEGFSVGQFRFVPEPSSPSLVFFVGKGCDPVSGEGLRFDMDLEIAASDKPRGWTFAVSVVPNRPLNPNVLPPTPFVQLRIENSSWNPPCAHAEILQMFLGRDGKLLQMSELTDLNEIARQFAAKLTAELSA